MKLYEYLASGLNVVTRATGPITARGLQDVHAYAHPESADAAYRRALRTNRPGMAPRPPP